MGKGFDKWWNEEVILPGQKPKKKEVIPVTNQEGEKTDFLSTDLDRYLIKIDEEKWTTSLSEFSSKALQGVVTILTNETSLRNTAVRLLKNNELKKKIESSEQVFEFTSVNRQLEKFKNSLLAARALKNR